MSKISDLWALIKTRVLTPSNEAKALDAVAKAAQSAADKARIKDAGLSKQDYKGGFADIAVICIVAMVLNTFLAVSHGKGGAGSVGFGDRMNAINVTNSSNITVTATVSPTGGGSLSIPVTGGGK